MRRFLVLASAALAGCGMLGIGGGPSATAELQPTKGSISIAGQDTTVNPNAARRQMGFLTGSTGLGTGSRRRGGGRR